MAHGKTLELAQIKPKIKVRYTSPYPNRAERRVKIYKGEINQPFQWGKTNLMP